jgi:pyrroline-5-carboxylate reductase
MARELVLGTVCGAADLMKSSGKDPAELRAAVTSKGGTTAAALATLEGGKFKDLMAEAVRAAHKRAIELGNPAEGGGR